MNNEDYAKGNAMDWAIMQTAIAFEGLEYTAPKKDKPYIEVVLNLIARKPREFRERCYVVGDIMFVDHECDKRSNVVKVRTTFDKKEFAD